MESLRVHARHLIENQKFQKFIMVLIIFNGILLGLETSKTVMEGVFGEVLHILDSICLWIFVAELGIAAFGYGLSFLKDPWRIFDTIVIGIALAPAGGGLSVLRGLRVLRVLRVINNAPSLKRIINAMIAAIPGMGSIAALLCILYYVAGVMATKLFGEAFPEWFGTLGNSFYTLFQVMTLESWSMGIVRPVMEKYPFAWAFFVPFITVATFTMLNLFVGVVVGAIQGATAEKPVGETPPDPIDELSVKLEVKMQQIYQSLEEVKTLVDREPRARKLGTS